MKKLTTQERFLIDKALLASNERVDKPMTNSIPIERLRELENRLRDEAGAVRKYTRLRADGIEYCADQLEALIKEVENAAV